ncbi:MAG TPA: carboxypeptidase-like regulatory domain-containing protein, partial [Gemmatimonadaceae bacterium]|nr:carboxypeptidase-like regulatory domain-containing protein [Gemmatimonadaceae bacterium]
MNTLGAGTGVLRLGEIMRMRLADGNAARRTTAIAVAAMLVALGRAAHAQPAIVEGRAHVSGDSARVVAGAEVALLPTLRTQYTDSAGHFRFGDVAPGTYTVRVRRIGFDVAMSRVEADHADVSVDIAMLVAPQALGQVTIRGKRVLFPARYAEAYTRVEQGKGWYFTHDLLDSLKAYDLTSILPLVPGVHVGRRIEFARCTTGAVLGSLPHVQVYLDGTR